MNENKSGMLTMEAVSKQGLELPPGWIKGFSSKEKRPYYFDIKTKKSVWSLQELFREEIRIKSNISGTKFLHKENSTLHQECRSLHQENGSLHQENGSLHRENSSLIKSTTDSIPAKIAKPRNLFDKTKVMKDVPFRHVRHKNISKHLSRSASTTSTRRGGNPLSCLSV